MLGEMELVSFRTLREWRSHMESHTRVTKQIKILQLQQNVVMSRRVSTKHQHAPPRVLRAMAPFLLQMAWKIIHK